MQPADPVVPASVLATDEPTTCPEPVKPPADERLPTLDLLRGIAILCILPANMPFYMGPTGFNPRTGSEEWVNRLVTAGTLLLIDAKFITMLSILFGAGLAIQFDRARESGKPFLGYYLWRMVLLFLIGLAHCLLLWFGDILASYAIVGMGAVLLCQLSPPTLKWVTRGVLGWFYFWMTAATVVFLIMFLTGMDFSFSDLEKTDAPKNAPAQVGHSDKPAEAIPDRGQEIQQRIEAFFKLENEQRIYTTGTFGERVLHRAVFLGIWIVLFWLLFGWYILGCFLIGVQLLRRGLFHDPAGQRPFIRRLLLLGPCVGVPLQLIATAIFLYDPKEESLAGPLNQLGALPQALLYLSVFLLWSQTAFWSGLQRRLRAVGRMALTNYLMQSVLCTTLFYGHGFGLFGQLNRAQALWVVAAVWILELLWSPVWLRYFQIGPVEWVWRSLADRRLRPLLRRA